MLDSFFKPVLTNRDENTWENEFNYWILHMKVRLYDNFQVNLRKKNFDPFCRTFLTNRGKNEDEDDKIWKNEFDFGILHIKIRL